MGNSNFSGRDMRDALSNFATGVSIVTTIDAAGDPVGMTASSFNSVSMDPPLILWSVTKTALSAQAFHDAKHFCVHILDCEQTDLSNKFARKGEDKFGNIDYTLSTEGIPQIAGALTRFDCETWAVYEGGDHWIIVGKVLELDTVKGEGLVFCHGSYATATPMRMASSNEASKSNDQGTSDDLLIYHLSRAHRQVTHDFYIAVRESGLSIPEWRVLASLHGRGVVALASLSRKTFVGHLPLQDLVLKMQDQGLCQVTGRGEEMQVKDTQEGSKRVDHLLKFAKTQERRAVGKTGSDGLDQLNDLLKQVIANTNP